jgi:hypothetical protein
MSEPSDKELRKAINAAVTEADGEPIGLKTLQKKLVRIFVFSIFFCFFVFSEIVFVGEPVQLGKRSLVQAQGTDQGVPDAGLGGRRFDQL